MQSATKKCVILIGFALLILVHPWKVSGQTQPLSFGMLPVVQALPIFVADELGLFKAEGLDVRLVPFRTALDKDVAITTGQIMGYFGDLFTPTVLKANGVDVRIVARNFATGQDQRMFAVLAGPKSGLTALNQLAGVPVAVSSNSIIDYVTVTLLKDAGLSEDQISLMETKNIPLRLQMLMTGQVQAATLPEPLVTLAETQGCKVLADDGASGLSSTVLIFSAKAIAERGDDIRKFFAAVDKAVEVVNTNPERVRPIMNRFCNVPPPLQGTYKIPSFPRLTIPDAVRVEAAVSWLAGRGILKSVPTYADLVDERFFR